MSHDPTLIKSSLATMTALSSARDNQPDSALYRESGRAILAIDMLCHALKARPDVAPTLPPYVYGRECGENEKVWTEAGVRQAIRAALEANAAPSAPSSPQGTPAANWRKHGLPDPHGTSYDCERAKLVLGELNDDELANAAFLNYDRRPSPEDLISANGHPPIVYMTAVKDRLRWLSRALEKALEVQPLAADNEPLFTCADPDLDLLLNSTADMVRQTTLTHDEAFGWHDALQKVEARLALAPVAPDPEGALAATVTEQPPAGKSDEEILSRSTGWLREVLRRRPEMIDQAKERLPALSASSRPDDDSPTFTLDQLAAACAGNEVPDSTYESLSIALASRRKHGPRV